MSDIEVRKGQGPSKLTRAAFSERFRARFQDPAFAVAEESIAALEEIAWEGYQASRKAPITRAAGPGFADASYQLSVEWLDTRRKLTRAEERHADPKSPSRVLVICGSARNDKTCPGENSKTFRLAKMTEEVLTGDGFEVDFLDLSLLDSDYDRHIHPCKACVSTAMPLCHWPCSCYPNHSLGQVNDWMNEIYERWVLAHGIILLTPVYWYEVPAGVKAMIDRLVCADGGNPDPTTTHGKDARRAKEIELAGWDYPKHLARRAFGLVVHGDAAGTESVRRALTDWLTAMELVPSGGQALLDRYIGYYEPYATSHAALDEDRDLQEEVKNVARAVAVTVRALRAGRMVIPDEALTEPRPK